MSLLDELLRERPVFHRQETETGHSPNAGPPAACHAVSRELAEFLHDSVGPGSRTLEVGSGVSTLLFASRGAVHTAVTPNAEEFAALRDYAERKGIGFGQVRLVAEASEHYLPRAEETGLDLVFIDGKHAYPWPVIDWFYTADRLKKGGLMVLDDVHLRSAEELVEFLDGDPRWSRVRRFGYQAVAYRKEAESAHDVAWHMQPFLTARRPLWFRALRKFRRWLE